MRRNVPVSEYLQALAVELSKIRESVSTSLSTVYFGGGTPSRLGPDGVAEMLALVRRSFELDSDVEVTLETNPEDVTQDAVSAWTGAGVNRLSLGIQTFDDSVLAWMHRTHSAADSLRAIAIARNGGIANLSVDLIFALPEFLGRSWTDDLKQAIDLEPDHISLYGLTIEKGTPLGRWQANGTVAAAPEDKYADQFLLAHEATTDAGFVHYEVSNFARDGQRSRHNSAYWKGVEYVGAGPSAHSFDGRTRHWNVAPYAEWRSLLASGDTVIEDSEVLTDDNRRAESVYLGLRTVDGYRASATDLSVANRWRDQGWATVENGLVRLTPEGWLRLDSLAAGLTGL